MTVMRVSINVCVCVCMCVCVTAVGAGEGGTDGLVDKYFMKEKIRLLYGSVLCTRGNRTPGSRS